MEFTVGDIARLVGAPMEGNPDAVVTPGIYVDAIFQGMSYEKRIEQRTYRPKGGPRA